MALITGTTGAETLTGTDGADTLRGLDGDDYLAGEAGDDSLEGGEGEDTLAGGLGDDTLVGGAGRDLLLGGAGTNVYRIGPGSGRDLIEAWFGVGTTQGVLRFEAGVSPSQVRVRSDQSDGAALTFRADALDIDVRVNLFLVGEVSPGVNGNTSENRNNPIVRVEFADGTVWDRDRIRELAMTGDDAAETVDGSAQDDRIAGGGGNDDLIGKEGADSIEGDAGDDRVFGGTGDDSIGGGTGRDTLFGDDGVDVLRGGDADDSLSGGADVDTLEGGNGNDVLNGDGGDDWLDGGPGDDRLQGGTGDNRYLFGPGDGRDVVAAFYGEPGAAVGTVRFKAGVTPEMVSARRASDDPGAMEFRLAGSDDVLRVEAVLRGAGATGSTVDSSSNLNSPVQRVIFDDGTTWDRDRIREAAFTGGSSDDRFDGTSDDDTMNGGAGDDVLSGARGDDRLSGGSGMDTALFSGVASAYSIAFDAATRVAAIADSTAGRDGVDRITGLEVLRFVDRDVRLQTPSGSAPELVLKLHAMYGLSVPTGAAWTAEVNKAGSLSATAYAMQLGAQFSSLSDAALVTRAFEGLGIVTPKLRGELAGAIPTVLGDIVVSIIRDYAALGDRHFWLLTLANLYGNLEADPIYGVAANGYLGQMQAGWIANEVAPQLLGQPGG